MHEPIQIGGIAALDYHDLDVELLASVIRAESGGNVHAVSRAGARGLMQLMPGTADQLGVSDSFRADQNINGGTAYLNALLLRYHDNLAWALAAWTALFGMVSFELFGQFENVVTDRAAFFRHAMNGQGRLIGLLESPGQAA